MRSETPKLLTSFTDDNNTTRAVVFLQRGNVDTRIAVFERGHDGTQWSRRIARAGLRSDLKAFTLDVSSSPFLLDS